MGPKGDQVLEARLVRKCGGIKWLDPDNGHRACETHPNNVAFEKKRGNDRCIAFGTICDPSSNRNPTSSTLYTFTIVRVW